MPTVSVLIVDDHTLFRRCLASMLRESPQLMVAGEAGDGFEAVEGARRLRPDIVLMDIDMPGMDGVEATKAIVSELPECKVVILTVSEKSDDLYAAIRAGAKAYLLKTIEPDLFVSSIVVVQHGGVVFQPYLASRILDEFVAMGAEKAIGPKGTTKQDAQTQKRQNLSAREREILNLVAKGFSNKEIGDALYISETTVKTHLRSILDKLHVRNRAEAAASAVRAGIGQATQAPPFHKA